MTGRPASNPYEPVPDREPFERQPKESEKAFQAFLFYRDLGSERTIEKATELYRKQFDMNDVEYGSRVLQGWSAKFGWQVRVEAWDRQLDNHRRKQQLKAIEKMRRKHIMIAEACQELAVAELEKFIKLAKSAEFRTITAAELIKVLESAAKLERQSLGEPDQIVEERAQITIEDRRKEMRTILTNEALLDDLDKLIKKASYGPNSKSTVN